MRLCLEDEGSVDDSTKEDGPPSGPLVSRFSYKQNVTQQKTGDTMMVYSDNLAHRPQYCARWFRSQPSSGGSPQARRIMCRRDCGGVIRVYLGRHASPKHIASPTVRIDAKVPISIHPSSIHPSIKKAALTIELLLQTCRYACVSNAFLCNECTANQVQAR